MVRDTTIAEAARAAQVAEAADTMETLGAAQASEAPEPPQGLWGWLTRPTGPGAIEDYVQDPLCFDGSRGLAQILRGLTGLLD